MRIFLTAAMVFAAIPAMADTQHCAALHARAPEQMADLPRTGWESYEAQNPGLGFGAQYRNAGTTLSVFYYDAGFHQIGPEHVDANFHGAMRDLTSVLQGQGLTLGEMLHYRVDSPGFFLNHLALGQDSSGRMQAVALGQNGNCIVKLRVTAPVSADQALPFFETIAAQLNASLP